MPNYQSQHSGSQIDTAVSTALRIPATGSSGDAGKFVTFAGTGDPFTLSFPNKITYVTSAPTSDNVDGTLRIAVLSSEPATKYANWLYIITSSS